jgi:hypothetical protein
MTQNVDSLPFLERFQQPLNRRAMLRAMGMAASAAALAIGATLMKGARPGIDRALPAEKPKGPPSLTARKQALAMRHPGPRG